MAFNPSIPPIRYSGNPIIAHSTVAWWDSQIFDCTVIPDPTNAANLLMYASGMTAPTQTGTMSIGLFHSTVAGFTSWTEHGGASNGQVLQPLGGGENHVRLGSVVHNINTNEIWFYYCSYDTPAFDGTICLAKAPVATPATLTRFGSNPVLTAAGNGNNDGYLVQQCSVVPPWISGLSDWVMIYEYRAGTAPAGTAQYRTATSPDGEVWTKTVSGDVLPAKPDGSSFSAPEMMQLVLRDGTWYLIFESGTGSSVPYAIYAVTASSPLGPFSSLDNVGMPIFGPTGDTGDFDGVHVATPFLVDIGGLDRLFYCGTDSDAPYTGKWSAGIATFSATLSEVVNDAFTGTNGTALTAHTPNVDVVGGGWLASAGTFEIQGNKAVAASHANGDMTVIESGESDGIIECTVTPRSTDGSNLSTADILFRFSDATHYWLMHFSSGSQSINIYEEAGTGLVLRQQKSVTVVDNTAYAIRIVYKGACITVYLDGVEALVYTKAQTNLTATKVGLRVGKAGTPPGLASWDNWLFQEFEEVTGGPHPVGILTQARWGIWGRRYGSFAGKTGSVAGTAKYPATGTLARAGLVGTVARAGLIGTLERGN